MGNLKAKHNQEAALSAKLLFKGVGSSVMTLQIRSNGMLDKHVTKVPALLVCVEGEVLYQDEQGKEENLKNSDFIEIEPEVVHWLRGIKHSQLLLIK